MASRYELTIRRLLTQVLYRMRRKMDPVVWMMYVYCFRDHTVYKRVEDGIRYYDEYFPAGHTWYDGPVMNFLLKYCIV